MYWHLQFELTLLSQSVYMFSWVVLTLTVWTYSTLPVSIHVQLGCIGTYSLNLLYSPSQYTCSAGMHWHLQFELTLLSQSVYMFSWDVLALTVWTYSTLPVSIHVQQYATFWNQLSSPPCCVEQLFKIFFFFSPENDTMCKWFTDIVWAKS